MYRSKTMKTFNNRVRSVLSILAIVLAIYFVSVGAISTIFDLIPTNGKTIIIEKTEKGFDTYYEDGTLQYEFTKQNTDSTTLETLKDIYEGE